jgi:phosphoribosyl-AMP cyclohydrolase
MPIFSRIKEVLLTAYPDFSKGGGLLPVIAQDAETGQVLMLAYMNREAWEKTLETGTVHYWSRSRRKLWLKGETSGHVQKVVDILVDCDLDTLLIKVRQLGGAACHEGYKSCFFRRLKDGAFEIIENKVFDPKEVYKT